MEIARELLTKWLARVERVSTTKAPAPPESRFLPDFCSANMVLNVIVIAEMLAFVVTLTTRRISLSVLQDLLLISIFVQWIALTSVAILCALRRPLSRLANLHALILVYALLLAITFVIGELAIWLLYAVGKIASARPEWYAYFHVQNLSVSAIVNALALRFFFAKHELQQRTASEARAKMQALQSRIRPIFLFNGMNIIASLIRTAPARAEEAIEDMADLLRMMLGDEENLVPVKNEIAVAKKYLSMESLRLDNRLRVDWNIGKFPRKAVMPVLTLQPLLEHVIHHTVEPVAAGNHLQVKLWEEGGVVHIRLAASLPAIGVKAAKHDASALDNMRQRFESHYGSAARLEVNKDNGDYVVGVALPARGGKQ
jgi:two-component system sensor histidine kinase AlgZ